MTSRLLSFGHGYSAQALSARLLAEGWQVTGTTRSVEKAERIAATGVTARIWPGHGQGNAQGDTQGNRQGADLTDDIATATHLLVSTAPGPEGDPVLGDWASTIAEHAGHIVWVGYLSTTGVYGDHGGDWVDEHTPLAPTTIRGQHRVRAETAWRDLARKAGLPLHIFRLAGIYGPGRGPFAKVRAGRAQRVIKQDQVFSRIHVDDIAQILHGSILKPDPGAIYNVCDDEAAPPQDVIAYAAELLGLPVPPAVDFETAQMSPMARSFYAESKRVRNNRMIAELGITLLYPSYREGLQAVLAQAAPSQHRDP